MADPLVVGIDLGTTHTVVAWAAPSADAVPAVFPVAQLVSRSEVEERPLLPSFLYAPPDGEAVRDPWGDAPWIVGSYARSRGQEIPGRLVSSAKSWLSHAHVDRAAAILPWGADQDGSAEGPRLSPVDASARILGHVRRAWNGAFPDRRIEEQQVVLTVPASFDQAARGLTVRAAQRARLNVRLLEEPQAAFYDYMHRAGPEALDDLADGDGTQILVCDVGGGTTDLTLIRVARANGGAVDVRRVAVGRHLLLGGDNVDLALAQICEGRIAGAKKLGPRQFAQLVLACRHAKEVLLGPVAPDDVPIRLLATGSSLVGTTLSTELTREEVEHVVLDGFLPRAAREAEPARAGRAGLIAFGLPYEKDPAVTRHLASFFRRHSRGTSGPSALLFNGGLFHAAPVAGRIVEVVRSWGGPPLSVLDQPDPDLAVARGAVVYGLALAGYGRRIGGGTAHGYYVSIASGGRDRKAICVVPRGAKEGERHLVRSGGLSLTVGKAVRFDLYASDEAPVHAPGEVVTVDDDRFELLPPVTTAFDVDENEGGRQVEVALEGELTPVGTVDLACVATAPAGGAPPRRFALEFELRGTETEVGLQGRRPSEMPKSSIRGLGRRFDEAVEAVQRVFGKGRKDVEDRESKSLLRVLERKLGERRSWDTEVCRALFDVIGPKHRARKRSPDHERMYWLLSGYCARPGFGHPLDPGRIEVVWPLFGQGLAFGDEVRGWEQFFIAWRRFSGGLSEARQSTMRDLLDPFLAEGEGRSRRPRGFKPVPVRQLLETASWLERVPFARRARLGGWLLERTWTKRDPQLWEAIGRIGARVPAYASVHHVVPPRIVGQWLDHLLRERWDELQTAPRAASLMARLTGDRARDVRDAVRSEVARRLEQCGAREGWIRSVVELVPVEEAERAELFGEELPVGLRLTEGDAGS